MITLKSTHSIVSTGNAEQRIYSPEFVAGVKGGQLDTHKYNHSSPEAIVIAIDGAEIPPDCVQVTQEQASALIAEWCLSDQTITDSDRQAAADAAVAAFEVAVTGVVDA